MHAPVDSASARRLLEHLYHTAVQATHGRQLLIEHSRIEGDTWRYDGDGAGEALAVPLPDRSTGGRVLIVGAGKAAGALAQGMEAVLGDRLDAGLVIIKRGHGEPLSIVRSFEAGHPVPDEAGLLATRALLALLETATPRDTIFCLLTGGASSLLVAPVGELTLADKARVGAMLVNSGASIQEINRVRKQLSAVKGGRLRRLAPCSTFCTLAISDVVGDDPATIGSGPTVPDDSTAEDALRILDRYQLRVRLPPAVITHLLAASSPPDRAAAGTQRCYDMRTSFRIIARLQSALEAGAREAARLGLAVRLLPQLMIGDTRTEARRFGEELRAAALARREGEPLLLLGGGETTLQVSGEGQGGRNQEFALCAAEVLQGAPRALLLAAGTDGTDGPTDAAGAFGDSSTWSRARACGCDPLDHLQRNDVYPLFEALGDLHRPGPTGTNVMDLVMGLAW